MRIALVHPFRAGPKDNWFPWFVKQMKGTPCVVPTMPHPDAPRQEEWLETLKESIGSVNDTILVGHSLGGVALLRYLQTRTHEERATATILIATPFDNCGRAEISNFFASEPNWEMIRARAGQIFMFQSTDDKIVPLEHASEYASLLTGTVVQSTGNGHFEIKTVPGLVNLVQHLVEQVG